MSKIEKYVQGLDYDSFVNNDMVIDAVLRNIVIHEYFGVDLDNIWKIVAENIPETKPHIIEMLKELEKR